MIVISRDLAMALIQFKIINCLSHAVQYAESNIQHAENWIKESMLNRTRIFTEGCPDP